jgi:Domain of unknown function (DUF5668)
MNRYILIRRLRGPAFLLLLGILALLHQTGVVYHFWHLFWPLALILWGVLLLAERAALEVDGYPQAYPDATYPVAPYPQGPNPGAGAGYGAGPYPGTPGTSIVPANSDDVERRNGGQS